jgi:hypothetical protein
VYPEKHIIIIIIIIVVVVVVVVLVVIVIDVFLKGVGVWTGFISLIAQSSGGPQ